MNRDETPAVAESEGARMSFEEAKAWAHSRCHPHRSRRKLELIFTAGHESTGLNWKVKDGWKAKLWWLLEEGFHGETWHLAAHGSGDSKDKACKHALMKLRELAEVHGKLEDER